MYYYITKRDLGIIYMRINSSIYIAQLYEILIVESFEIRGFNFILFYEGEKIVLFVS